MKKTNDLAIIKTIMPTLEQATNIEIKDNPSLIQATELLSSMNNKLDILTIDKEKMTKPLMQSLKEIRLKYKPYEDALNASISDVRQKMSDYATHEKQREQEAIEAIAARVLPGKGNLTIETAVKRIEDVKKLPEAIQATSGSLKFRPLQRLKITSPSDVPDEYWTINEQYLLTALKDDKTVSGAFLETIQVPYNKRK